jgi:FAD/FMN-containing dehydrogenase
MRCTLQGRSLHPRKSGTAPDAPLDETTHTHPMSSHTSLIQSLQTALGTTHVLTEGDLTTYERDWRGLVRGRALAVALPGNVDEVAAVVRACADHGASIVPQGGNTGLALGSVPDASATQVVLSLRRMNHVRTLDRANLTMTVEAGCILQTLQQTAQEAGFLFPLSLAAKGSCTIGGNLATNAGGTQVVHYGNTRALCLGLEVVTVEGAVWNGLSGLRKDNTGYDLRDLFVGSEGTLGVITAATLRIHPLPKARRVAWAAVPDLDAALKLLDLAHHTLGPGLTGFEVMSQFALTLVDRYFPQLRVPMYRTSPWCVLIEHSDHESEEHARAQLESLLQHALESGAATDAIVAESLAQSDNLWHMRESISMAQAKEGVNVKHDISIPIARIPAFVAETDALLARAIPGVRLVDFGHLGDGNLHYNVQAPEGVDAVAFLQAESKHINQVVFDAVARYDGSISAEHGIGSFKADLLPHYKSPVAMALMRRIKRALDPDNRMNPGRVLTTEPEDAGRRTGQ